MSYFQFAPLFAGIANLALAVFVFTRDPRLRLNRVFFLWGLSLTIWNIGAFALFRIHSADTAFLVARILHMGVVFLPVLLLHLSLLITRSRSDWRLTVAYVVVFALAVTNLFGGFLAGVRHVGYAWFALAGPGFWVFSAVLPAITIPSLVILIRKRRQVAGQERRQLAQLIGPTILLFAAGLHDVLPVLGFTLYPGTNLPIYPWGTFVAGIYGIVVGYAILHNQALAVRVTLSRVAAATLRLSFLLAVAFLLMIAVAVFSPEQYPFYLFGGAMLVVGVSTLVASFMFPKLLASHAERLERRIRGGGFELQEFVRRFNESLPPAADLPTLVAATAELLTTRLRVRYFAIVLLHPETRQVQLLRSVPPSKVDWNQNGLVFSTCLKLAEDCIDLRDPPLMSGPTNPTSILRSELNAFGAQCVVKLHTTDIPFGLLVVGDPTHQRVLDPFDFELLRDLGAQVAMAAERIWLTERAAVASKLESVAVMSRGLAHDLGNLITPVSTFLRHMRGRFPDDSVEAEVNLAAIQSIKIMEDYVREAMFFTKRLTPNLTEISLANMLQSARQQNDAHAAARGVRLEVTSADETRLRADGVLLHRLLTNLLRNAVDASVSGGKVELLGGAIGSGWVRITVKDHGCGIPPENIGRVFEPYFTTKEFGEELRGFGLGLTICQKIVHLHRGTISVTSEVDVGTTITVDLPGVLAGEDENPAAARRDDGEPGRTRLDRQLDSRAKSQSSPSPQE